MNDQAPLPVCATSGGRSRYLRRIAAAVLPAALLMLFSAAGPTSTALACMGPMTEAVVVASGADVCMSPPQQQADVVEAPSPVASEPEPPAPPRPNPTGRSANELGRVLIMEYHRIWNPEAPWQRTPAGFRRDLERLYGAGFRSVPLADVLANTIDLPPGTTPVVFTFDDSYVSQFWWADGGVPAVDSAVGVMQAFAATHPDFGVHGVFYITWNTLFGAKGAAGTVMLKYLVEHGFELGNHTMSHVNFGRSSGAQVQAELGQEQALVRQSLEGYEMSTMALPYGAWPLDKNLAVSGGTGNQRYHFAAVLQVGSEPAPSPASTTFNPLVLPRVQAGEALLSYWLNWFDTHPDERYVSDGDPSALTFPLRLQSHLRPDMTQYFQIKAY